MATFGGKRFRGLYNQSVYNRRQYNDFWSRLTVDLAGAHSSSADFTLSFSALFEESIDLNEEIAKTFSFELTESVDIAETAALLIALAVSESLNITDSLQSLDIFKALSENLDITEEAVKDFIKTLSGNVNVNDSLAFLFATSLAEASSVSESITKQALKALFESLDAEDFKEPFAISAEFSELISITATVGVGSQLLLNESLGLDPQSDIQWTILRTFAQSLDANVEIQKFFSFDLTEDMEVIEALSNTVQINFFDSALITDSEPVKSVTKPITENLELSAQIDLVADFFRELTEATSLTEVLEAATAFHITLFEDLNVTERQAFEAFLGEVMREYFRLRAERAF